MIRWLTADVFDGLATLEDGSVDLVVTSPPFLALRSYLPADHPDKGKEIGSEATPAAFLDTLLAVTAELGRVLAPHGSIAIELGDTYAGSGGAGGDYGVEGWREGQNEFRQGGKLSMSEAKRTGVRVAGHNGGGDGWPLAKSKTLIPELYRIALAYGFNPLTGEPSPAGRWRVRNVVTWCRPNPPVGALGDKWRPATSDVVVACRSGKRFWDDLATRKSNPRINEVPRVTERAAIDGRVTGGDNGAAGEPMVQNPSGAPLLDYWEIPLLDGEEPKPYGPTEKVRDYSSETSMPVRNTAKGSQTTPDNLASGAGSGAVNPSGAPLLDYWEIPLLDGEEPKPYGPTPRQRKEGERSGTGPKTKDPENDAGWAWERTLINHPSGAPLLDYWEIPPTGYAGAHYAVYPPALVEPLVKAMCPEKVCRTCGEPSRRVVEQTDEYREYRSRANSKDYPPSKYDAVGNRGQGMIGTAKRDGGDAGARGVKFEDRGFTDCGHDDWRPGIVLDPFAGSGTTLAVASGHGHDAIGIDLDPRNEDLARERVGPLMWET